MTYLLHENLKNLTVRTAKVKKLLNEFDPTKFVSLMFTKQTTVRNILS
jgi:hypothetical protein